MVAIKGIRIHNAGTEEAALTLAEDLKSGQVYVHFGSNYLIEERAFSFDKHLKILER
ncbi:hypothetical protein JXJ21_07215 [candidate division KSB1 bacterium]|nr:hypothetical protein [candidate division KSB1 bacterium]